MIREANLDDYDAIWEIFEQVVKDGDTFVFDPETPKEDLAKYWLSPGLNTYVFENEGKIIGTYVIKANQIGLGSHIANGSYMVHQEGRGKGVGKRLCAHSLSEAERLGFKAMQFNIVVSTNTAAVSLWEKMGFAIIGTVPEAFRHLKLGLVDGHVMYRKLG
jgi:L-amino acid N-acyltransferase YncA